MAEEMKMTTGVLAGGVAGSMLANVRKYADREREPDAINHPPHYTAHPSGVEAIAITEHFNFCLGNAIKYIWRSGLKNTTTELEDLKKARWYLDREITRREKGK
jgi:hypothetical protein